MILPNVQGHAIGSRPLPKNDLREDPVCLKASRDKAQRNPLAEYLYMGLESGSLNAGYFHWHTNPDKADDIFNINIDAE